MSLTLEEIPSGPHLIAPFRPQRSGVDYINLRQVNLDLMASCIPGTNNATRFVRPYSLMCWIYWIYPRLLERRGNAEASSEQLRVFREKVESLHLWGHLLEGVSGLPGTNSKPPQAGKDGLVDLSFDAWGERSATNTSLQAGVQYGPSLLDLGGIGYLHNSGTHFYQVTERGEKLARALDGVLRESPNYASLTDLDQISSTEEVAKELFQHWRIDETSLAEQVAFQSTFWNVDSVNKKTGQGRRSATIQLVLEILLASEKPLSEQEIRERMAFPRFWGRLPEELDEGLQRQSRLWVLLQFRQLQRLALESLMGWVEGQLLYQGKRVPDQIIDKAHAAICDYLSVDPTVSVDELLAAASEPLETIDDYLAAREAHADWLDLDLLIKDLLRGSAEEDEEACPTSFYVMLLIHNCRGWMESDPTIEKQLHHGGAARVSFAYWFSTIDKLRDRPAKELIDWTIKNLIISQHFAVGTNRFDGERIRLRFILEEEGLESLVTSSWHPIVTPDRLGTLLSLMVSCGLIGETEEGYICHQR